jgi:glyoxylase-like metal-dependent hydrolase (beta-lactamase superfamily II)
MNLHRRGTVLGVLLALGGLTMAVRAYQPPPAGGAGQPAAPKVVETEKIDDRLFMLRGGGGNTAVFIGANGVVIVDTKNPGWGRPILDKIKELTDKPVTTIVNTHTHGDHVSGNVEFPATVDIVVQDNTKTNMEKMAQVAGLPPANPPQPPPANIFKQNDGKGLPKRTFTDRMTLGKGPDQVDLYYFGRGHTNGDAWIVFPALRVMHAGDIFSGKNLPLLDVNNGGSGVAIPETLAKAHSTVKNVDKIITGHSTVMTMSDLAEYVEFNRDFLKAVQDAKKAGQTTDEIIKSWTMPAKYTGYTAPQPLRLKSNVEIIYNEVK